MKYEYPQGRRVNALATYEPFGPAPRLDAAPFERTLTVGRPAGLPAGPCRRRRCRGWWCWTTPASTPARWSRRAGRGWRSSAIYLYYLPAYSPELNRIEPVFKQVKHHEIPVRSHKSKAELREAVERGFDAYGDSLRPKSDKELRPAA